MFADFWTIKLYFLHSNVTIVFLSYRKWTASLHFTGRLDKMEKFQKHKLFTMIFVSTFIIKTYAKLNNYNSDCITFEVNFDLKKNTWKT